MANDIQYAIIVNRALSFVRILVDEAKWLDQDDTIPGRHKIHAFLDCAVWQLNKALIYSAVEVATTHQNIIDEDYHALELVLQQLQERGLENAQTRELQELLTSSTWLRELVSANNNPHYLAQLLDAEYSRVQQSNPQNQIIPVVNIDEASSKGPIELISNWMVTVQSFIERHRALAVEE